MHFIRAIMRHVGNAIAAASFIALAWGGLAIAQQQGFSAINPILIGHFMNAGSGSAAVPTYTNCALLGTPSDTDGACTTSSTSGAIIFAQAYATAPYCVVADASSTTVPPTYTTTTTQITLSTIITAHVLFWHCASRTGG
jgi:hypothetical protein